MKALKERIAKGIQEAPVKEENYDVITAKAEAYLNQALDALEGKRPPYTVYSVTGGRHALSNAEITKISGDGETLLLVEVSKSRVRVQPDDYDAIVLNDEDAAAVRDATEILKKSKFAVPADSSELPEGLDTLIKALKDAVGEHVEFHERPKTAGFEKLNELRRDLMTAITMEKLGMSKEQAEDVVEEFEKIVKDFKGR